MVGSATLFPVELRRRRHAAGFSLADLAAATHYSKGYLSKVETGRKPANADLARRCDAALDAGGQLAALVAQRVAAPPVEEPALDTEVWTMTLDPDGSGSFAAFSRRQALAAGTASLLHWQLGNGGTPAVEDSTVARFGVLFDEIRNLGRVLSPTQVLPMVIAQTHTLRTLAVNRSGPDQRKLLLLAGRHAEYAGWMAQESGDERAALWWIDTAIELATAARDRDMQAYGWVRRAGVLLYRDDAAGVIDLARRAQQVDGLPPRIRALAALREAQGHALAGEPDDCLRALDRAATLRPATHDEDTPTLGSTSVPDQLSLTTGWCLFDLGRPGASAHVLDKAVETIPLTAKRAGARFGARRALAHAAIGDVERACAIARDAIAATSATDSATVRLDLRRLARTLARWHAEPAVRDLQPHLAQLHPGINAGPRG
jgi:transcriptional regulator with XRE-family HTH domain